MVSGGRTPRTRSRARCKRALQLSRGLRRGLGELRRHSQRWAREKAKAFLTGRATKGKEPAPNLGEFAARYVEDHVRASRLHPSTAAHMYVSLTTTSS